MPHLFAAFLCVCKLGIAACTLLYELMCRPGVGVQDHAIGHVLRVALCCLSHASVLCHVESHPRIVVRELAQSLLPRSGPGSASLSV